MASGGPGFEYFVHCRSTPCADESKWFHPSCKRESGLSFLLGYRHAHRIWMRIICRSPYRKSIDCSLGLLRGQPAELHCRQVADGLRHSARYEDICKITRKACCHDTINGRVCAIAVHQGMKLTSADILLQLLLTICLSAALYSLPLVKMYPQVTGKLWRRGRSS